MRTLRHLLITLAMLCGVAACSSTPSNPAGTGDEGRDGSGRPIVHASSPVWASVVRAVAGDDAVVTSTSMTPSQDPHSFEPSAQDKLAFSKAGLIVLNGGHYDEWAEVLVKSLGKESAVINAVELSGLGGDHANEHVFQSIPTAQKVSHAVAERLASIDPDHAASYRGNASRFESTVGTLLRDAQAKVAAHKGAKVVATEAVAGLLVADLGLDDVTPESYVEQSETDDGPSVAVLAETEKVLTGGAVAMLLVNAQTTDEASQRLARAAERAGVPVVAVHETMPEGVDSYDAYMTLHIDGIEKALS